MMLKAGKCELHNNFKDFSLKEKIVVFLRYIRIQIPDLQASSSDTDFFNKKNHQTKQTKQKSHKPNKKKQWQSKIIMSL